MLIELLPRFIRTHYEVHEWRHATAILHNDLRGEWDDVVCVLMGFRLRKSAILTPGGRKSPIADSLDSEFLARGWIAKRFHTGIVVDGTEHQNPTHEIDCYRNRVALEVEWNNKDPFYDRDLNNFRVLFDLGAISLGIIITRSEDLQEIFAKVGKGSSYGASTTHMSRLIPRIEGGGGGGCPILVFGIKADIYVEDQ